MAVLLERSIIFVSNSKNRLSSALFTVRNLISPFKWWHVFIPIVPTSLMDVIEAPVPVLLGLTKD
jgi:DENN (AEX-3) domain